MLNKEQRIKSVSEAIGVGFSAPYILIQSPNNKDSETITLYDSFDEKMVLSELNAPRISKADVTPRYSARSTTSGSPSGNKKAHHTKTVRQVIPLDKTVYYNKGEDKAILEYEVDFFAQQPFYNEFGQYDYDNKKFVRVTLVGGAGINFNSNRRYGLEYSYYAPSGIAHHKLFYKYRDYLDRVTVSSHLEGNNTELYEFFPKNSDRELSKLTYNSSIKIGVGFSIPKSPISSVEVSSKKSVTYESGNFMDFKAQNSNNSYSVTYTNKRYGSEVKPIEDGYCDLIDDASGCWKVARSTYDAPFNLAKLEGTPYGNGFVPKYSVTYMAPRSTTGVSNLKLDTTIYGMSLLGHSRWAAGRLFYHGWRGTNNREYDINTYRLSTSMGIDWSSPLFSGAEPVTLTSLYGSDDKAQCITVQDNNKLALAECKSGEFNQLFYYTPELQYVYANDNSLCLSTAESVLSLKQCLPYASNSQAWYWDNAESSAHTYLYTTSQDGSYNLINLANADNNGIPLVTLTSLNGSVDTLFNSRVGKFLVNSIH